MSDFEKIIGHLEIINILTAALSGGRVSHAYLFAGPNGVGKTTVARIFSRALLCSGPRGGDSCGECRSCKQFEAGTHPDFHFLSPEGTTIKIARFRELHQETSLLPYQGDRQVYLIKDADTMTREAANSFLKGLEEPPPGVVFVLISDNSQSVLPTIRSRCQQVIFKPLSNYEVSRGLEQLRGLSERESRVPAALAGGSLGRALELVDMNRERDELPFLLEKLDGATPAGICSLAGDMVGKEFNLSRLLDMLLLWYRDLLIWKTGKESLIVNRDLADALKSRACILSEHRIIQNVRAVEKAEKKLLARGNTRLVLEDLFFTLTGIGNE